MRVKSRPMDGRQQQVQHSATNQMLAMECTCACSRRFYRDVYYSI